MWKTKGKEEFGWTVAVGYGGVVILWKSRIALRKVTSSLGLDLNSFKYKIGISFIT